MNDIPLKSSRQFEAYGTIFKIENIFRVAMHNCLVKSKGTDYFSEKTFQVFEYEYGGNIINVDTLNIVNKAMAKKNEEIKYKEKLGFEYPYLWYLEYAHLIMILDHYWDDYFLDMFLKPKNVKSDLINRGIKISPIRNSIAHNRYISDIEYGDLKSFHEVVIASVKDDFLKNYNELVYNKLEELRQEFIGVTKELILLVKLGKVISRSDLRDWKNLFGSILPQNVFIQKVSLFNEVFELVKKYSKELPRKPGSLKEIQKFVNENDLIAKMNLLIL